MKLEVLYEDNHCLAVNKPAGCRRRATSRARRRWWTSPAGTSSSDTASRGTSTSGLVHRLDRPTSGVVLLARTSKAAGRLAAQFRDGAVEKVYWAIVEGSPEEDEGVWTDRLEKDRRTNQSRVAGGIRGGRQGGGGGLPRAGTLAGGGEARIAALDRAESPAQGAAREPGAADPGRREVRGEEPDRGDRRRRPDRAARSFAAIHSPDSWGSDRGRGAGAGRLARALAIASGIAVRVQ